MVWTYGADGKDFDILIDINRKMQEGKGRGYERWAKIFNVKQMSKVLLYLQEHDIRDYEDLEKKAKSSAVKKAFDKRGLKKLPRVKDLSSEYGSILAEKRKLYEEYRTVKKEMMNYQIAKQDIDRFLKIDEEQGRQQEKTR